MVKKLRTKKVSEKTGVADDTLSNVKISVEPPAEGSTSYDGLPNDVPSSTSTAALTKRDYKCGNAACGKVFSLYDWDVIKCPFCGWTK